MQVFVLSIIHPTLICLWDLGPMQVTIMSVTFFGFYIVGASTGGFLSDAIGRKKTLVIRLAPVVESTNLCFINPARASILI